MNTTKNNRKSLFAIVSLILLIGGGLLLYQTLTVFYCSISAVAVILLALLSLFLYIVGTTLMARCGRTKVSRCSNDINGGIAFALLLVAAGMLLLGFNTGYLPLVWKGFFFSWQMLLFIIGVGCICRFQFIWGTIIAATGMFFLFSKAAIIYPDNILIEQFASTYWSLLIVVFGLLILFSTIFCGKNKKCCRNDKWKEKHAVNESENNDGKINFRMVFNATEQVLFNPIFRGGNIDVSFGAIVLDLSRTALVDAETFLYINTTFGGVELTIPDSWDIEIRSNSVAGGITDSRKKHIEKDRTKKLIIVTKCTFSGIDIK